MKTFADEFDEQFKIEVETVAFKFQPVKAVAAEDFEHGEWIAEALEKKDVDEGGEKPVAEVDEEAQAELPGEPAHFPDVAPAVTGAEHEGCATGDERFEQGVVIFKVVFEVG